MTEKAESRQHIDAVLAERARLLAQPAIEISAAPTVELVGFSAGNERYAVECAFVYRLEVLGNITPLPGAARWFAGITNLHGQVVPLIDLGVLLGTAPCATPSFAVVLGERRAEIGILAEMLLDMRALPVDVLRRRVMADGTTIVDGKSILADARLVVQEEIR